MTAILHLVKVSPIHVTVQEANIATGWFFVVLQMVGAVGLLSTPHAILID